MKAERIAFVLAGGGARGAYEAGALSIRMPAPAGRSRPSIHNQLLRLKIA